MKLLISLIGIILISFNSYSKNLKFNVSSSTNSEFDFPHNIIFYVNNNNNKFAKELKRNLITYLGESNFNVTTDSLRANVFLEINVENVIEDQSLNTKLFIKDKKQNIFWRSSLKDKLKDIKGNEKSITKAMMWTLGKNFSGKIKINEKNNKVLTKYKWQSSLFLRYI